jgi:hypothetical protein
MAPVQGGNFIRHSQKLLQACLLLPVPDSPGVVCFTPAAPKLKLQYLDRFSVALPFVTEEGGAFCQIR